MVSAGFVLFRSDSLSMAGQVFMGMVQKSRYPEWESGMFYTGINAADFTVLAAGLAILFLIMVFGWYGKGYDMGAFIYSKF